MLHELYGKIAKFKFKFSILLLFGKPKTSTHQTRKRKFINRSRNHLSRECLSLTNEENCRETLTKTLTLLHPFLAPELAKSLGVGPLHQFISCLVCTVGAGSGAKVGMQYLVSEDWRYLVCIAVSN